MKLLFSPKLLTRLLVAAGVSIASSGAQAQLLGPIAGEAEVNTAIASRPNLALASGGATAFASSYYGGFGPELVNNGINNGGANAWIANTADNGEYVGIAFSSAVTLGAIVFDGQDGYNWRSGSTWSLQYTTEASPGTGTTSWTQIGTYSWQTWSPLPRAYFEFGSIANVTGIRLVSSNVVAAGFNQCIQELEAYGVTPIPPAIAQISPAAVGAGVDSAVSGRPNLALASGGATAFASSSIGGYGPELANNGIINYSAAAFLVGTVATDQYLAVAFPSSITLSAVVWMGQYGSRSVGAYTLQYTTDPTPNTGTPSWTTLGQYYFPAGAGGDGTVILPRSYFELATPIANVTGIRLGFPLTPIGYELAIQEFEAYGPLPPPSGSIWTNLNSGNWSDPANWLGGIVANGADNTANFSTLDIPGWTTVTLDGARTIGNLSFADTANTEGWFLSGDPLTLAVSSGSPTITVAGAGGYWSWAQINAVLSGAVGLTKDGPGKLILNAANNYTGNTIIDAGTLAPVNASSLGGGTSPVTVNATGYLVLWDVGLSYPNSLTLNGGKLQQGTSAADIWTGSVAVAAPSTVEVWDANGTLTLGGVVSGSGTLIKDSAGTLTLTNVNTHTGDLTIVGGGNLVVGGSGQLGGGNYAGHILNWYGTFTYNSSANQTMSGYMDGGGNVVQKGPGTLTFSANNWNGGFTTISNGTLLVNGWIQAWGGVTNVGGILGGSGYICQSDGPNGVTVQAGGTLRPGLGGTDTSPLTVQNAVSLAGTTVIAINRTNVSKAAKLVATGALTQGGTLTVTNVGPASQAGDSFTLATAGSYSGIFSATNLPAPPSGLSWSLGVVDSNLVLAVVGPPAFVTQPLGGILPTGDHFVLSAVTGGGVTSYSWLKNGSVVGAASTYDIPSASASDSGAYQLIIANAHGSATSSVAQVTVLAANLEAYQQSVTAESSLVSYYKFDDSTANDYVGGYHGTPAGGIIAYDASFNATNNALDLFSTGIPADYSWINAGANTAQQFTDGTGTVEFWMRCSWTNGTYEASSDPLIHDYMPAMVCSRDQDNPTGNARENWGIFIMHDKSSLFLYTGVGTAFYLANLPTSAGDGWHHCAVVFSTAGSTNATIIWDGAPLITFTNAPLGGNPLASLEIGATASWGRGPFLGKLDEVALYADALSTTAVQNHVRAAYGLGSNPVLNTAKSGNNLVLSWVDPGNWVLESTAQLSPASWTPVQTNGSPATVQISGNKFFRLKAQ